MPTATVTVREIKNKSTGIDITVPNYKQLPGLLSSTFVYRVVVVSNLEFFKSPKHRESDNVQFMVEKKFNDFEDLHEKLNTKFSGTVFPPLPKKVLLVNEAIAKHRRGEIEHFFKFITSVSKIATSSVVLEFLGVGLIKAGTFRSRDNVGSTSSDQTDDEYQDITSTVPDTNLFENDNKDDQEELFVGTEYESEDNKAVNAQLFDAQDFGGGITDNDTNLFLPDAMIEKVMHPTIVETVNQDLYRIEDDFEDRLKVTKKSTRKFHDASPDTHNKKPELRPKPPLKPKPTSVSSSTSSNVASTGMTSDDIMSYIQQNDADDDDVELFL